MLDLKIEGKRALVTGSSSCIGEAIARMLAREGATVVARPTKVAAAVAFRASPLTNFITRANLRVDGGYVTSIN